MPKQKGDFSTVGTESFELNGSEVSEKPKLTLNIEDSEPLDIVLDQQPVKTELTGNFLVDLYNRVNNYFIRQSGVTIDAKANFFHLLAVMINSGIPMVKALKSLSIQTSNNPKLQMVVKDLEESIENGFSLSEAMLKHEDIFTEQEMGMIQAGEASGQLSRVLDRLAYDTEKAYSIRRKVKNAMLYPVIVFTLLLAVIAAMMIFVIPQLTELFSSIGEDLPALTKAVIAVSDFMVGYKAALGIGLLVFILGYMAFKRTAQGRYTVDAFKLKIPVFGPLYKKSFLSRFSRSLSNLLDSNVTILKTMEIVANSIGNEVYRQKLLLSLEDIKQGIPLAENLSESDLFPPMLVNMVEVGEQTAQLDEISAKIADFYESEVDTSVAGLSKVLEPIILVVIGLTVGLVVAAIMLPIMQISDLAGGI